MKSHSDITALLTYLLKTFLPAKSREKLYYDVKAVLNDEVLVAVDGLIAALDTEIGK